MCSTTLNIDILSSAYSKKANPVVTWQTGHTASLWQPHILQGPSQHIQRPWAEDSSHPVGSRASSKSAQLTRQSTPGNTWSATPQCRLEWLSEGSSLPHLIHTDTQPSLHSQLMELKAKSNSVSDLPVVAMQSNPTKA